MRSLKLIYLILISCALLASCKKDEKKKGKLSASIKKSETVSDSAALRMTSGNLLDGTGSTVQSFTPKSLKASIFYVSACQSGGSNCTSLYRCAANTVEDCAVELSDIDAFVDAVNSGEVEAEDGATFDSIAVSYCKDGETDGIQHLSFSGTVDILGTTYATDPDKGLLAGSVAKDVSVEIAGGCASMYQLDEAVTVSKDDPKKVTLFFDASLFAVGGIAGGSSHAIDYTYPDGGPGCVGSEDDAFACISGVNVVSTVDEGEPTTEHYLLADTNTETGGSATSAPTSMMTLYFSSSDKPIGGVQSSYRASGVDVSFGQTMGGGLGLYPTVIDSKTLEIGKPEGSISLANWFKEFKRETHSGTYTYDAPGHVTAEGSYTATKLD